MSGHLHPIAWLDGSFAPLDTLSMPVPSPSAQYGTALFEGIMAYPAPGGVNVVALREHLERLRRGCAQGPILPGITRRIVCEELAPKLLGERVRQADISKGMLREAESVLLTGTAAEVVRASVIDDSMVGAGVATERQKALIAGYRELVSGKAFAHLLTMVEIPST